MEQLLTIEDVADLLQKPVGWVEQQIRMDYLEVVLLGNDWPIEPQELRRFVDDRRILSPLMRAVPDTERR